MFAPFSTFVVVDRDGKNGLGQSQRLEIITLMGEQISGEPSTTSPVPFEDADVLEVKGDHQCGWPVIRTGKSHQKYGSKRISTP